MRFLPCALASLLALCQRGLAAPPSEGNITNGPAGDSSLPNGPPNPSLLPRITPKVMIVSMFAPEADVWYENMRLDGFGDLLALNISVPGTSPKYPYVHCTLDGQVCQMTTCEGEINAATSMMALAIANQFDFRKTYWLVAGIAGVNPKYSTIGGVALARYSVQAALQYEFDAREMPDNFSTGYVAFGTMGPDHYPTILYGTEVFEVNQALRDRAFDYASKANLTDNEDSKRYRARYKPAGNSLAMASSGPSVVKCDTVTSDVYYSGKLLSESFERTVDIWTNGTGRYCMTAQEDNATLAALIKAAIFGFVDFARVIILRTGSNFDRPPPGVTAYEHLLVLKQNGFAVAIGNLYLAGIEIVKGILNDWTAVFDKGVKPCNYIGDIFGSLGGEPDYGPGSLTGGQPVKPAV
ncbi:purine nucleoside permease-domain-containing protein [Triangularia verruculosa]|uniref:Purine nucleoside permease-domain-containing protein n=1 Tax=Triangularia verruculosa TaxID=2587418 RepID=A0AAN6X945_9PEZI|nr:purine nucleoside permease-domain-containing protein [Triangularia verruculosa]